MSITTVLNNFLYNTKNPVTVRHASLLNAVTSQKPQTVYEELQRIVETLTKKTQTDEILSALFILKRDSNWVKKMFMGSKGIDVTVTACVKKQGPKKRTESDEVKKRKKKTESDQVKKRKEKTKTDEVKKRKEPKNRTDPEKKKRKKKNEKSFKETENNNNQREK